MQNKNDDGLKIHVNDNWLSQFAETPYGLSFLLNWEVLRKTDEYSAQDYMRVFSIKPNMENNGHIDAGDSLLMLIKCFASQNGENTELAAVREEIRKYRSIENMAGIAPIDEAVTAELDNGDAFVAVRMRDLPVAPLTALSESEAKEYGRQLCRGLAELHRSGIYLHILTPERIFECAGGYKLSCSFIPERCRRASRILGQMNPRNMMFAVPETCADGLCSESADVYSVGMFMYTRLNGGLLPWQTRPGDNSELQTILDRRAEHLPEIPGVEPMLMNILRKATSPDPLERYRSAEEMLCALSGQQKTSVYSSCFSREIRVGDTVQFGTYYSEKGIFNPRMKPMEWLVLAIDATNEEKPCALIISRDTVDCMKFSDSASFANWDNSVLNGFLNREFLNVLCRSGADRERIRNSGMLKDVFLLSADDVVSYRDILLPNLAKATKHAAQNGVLQNEYGNTCWWLRSTDSNGRHASFVAYNGELRRSGCRVDSDGIGVRPAIWLTL